MSTYIPDKITTNSEKKRGYRNMPPSNTIIIYITTFGWVISVIEGNLQSVEAKYL